jgi:nucleotide-binding universal stress UspA family protein
MSGHRMLEGGAGAGGGVGPGARSAGVAVDVVIEEGDVAERVAAVAASLDADLVVVGTEARGAIRGMILGDTTREILRRSPCPVIVVPPGAEIDED